MFNCGEGTQRLAHEHKTKLARLEHIFMTRTTWDRTGGLPGLSLTLQDTGVPNLTLHGPDGLVRSFDLTYTISFSFRSLIPSGRLIFCNETICDSEEFKGRSTGM